MPSRPPVALLDIPLFRTFDRQALEDLGCVHYQCIYAPGQSVMLIPVSWYDRIPNNTELVTKTGLGFTFRQGVLSDVIIIGAVYTGQVYHLNCGFPVPNEDCDAK